MTFMSAVKIAINGFGRIGRLVLRAGLDNPDLEFVGINDLVPPDNLAYLLQHDSTHGRFKGTVEAQPDGMVVNGRFIPCTAIKNPVELPWGSLGSIMSSNRRGCLPGTRELPTTWRPGRAAW